MNEREPFVPVKMCDPSCKSFLVHHQGVVPGLGPSDRCPGIAQQRSRREEERRGRKEERDLRHLYFIEMVSKQGTLLHKGLHDARWQKEFCI